MMDSDKMISEHWYRISQSFPLRNDKLLKQSEDLQKKKEKKKAKKQVNKYRRGSTLAENECEIVVNMTFVEDIKT